MIGMRKITHIGCQFRRSLRLEKSANSFHTLLLRDTHRLCEIQSLVAIAVRPRLTVPIDPPHIGHALGRIDIGLRRQILLRHAPSVEED